MRHSGSCLDGSPASQSPWGALSPPRGALKETPGPTCKTLARDEPAGLMRGQGASGLLWGWGNPGTFWKSRPPCPVGFNEDNRDSPRYAQHRRPSCCDHSPISTRGGWGQVCRMPPPGKAAPRPERGSPRLSARHKADGPSSSGACRPGAPGDAWRRSGEAGTPSPNSKTHNCFLSRPMRGVSAPGRKSACSLASLRLPAGQAAAPWPIATLSADCPCEPPPTPPLPRPPEASAPSPCPQGSHSPPAPHWLPGGVRALLCSAPWTSVTWEGRLWPPSPRHMSAPRTPVSPSDSLHLPSGARHAPQTAWAPTTHFL